MIYKLSAFGIRKNAALGRNPIKGSITRKYLSMLGEGVGEESRDITGLGTDSPGELILAPKKNNLILFDGEIRLGNWYG